MQEPVPEPIAGWRPWILVVVSTGAVLAVALHAPIQQDPRYHVFADTRLILGVPNFWNVVSNAPFLLVGAAGLFLLVTGETPGLLPALRIVYGTLFLAIVGVGLGSAWYHLRPDNDSLVWDRLPMTVAFMAFFSIILGERLRPSVGRLSLAPLLFLGIASILVWRITEASGRGDLRLYGLVQYLPVLLIPIILLLFPAKASGPFYTWGVLLAYAAAKVLELFDRPIFQSLGFISGHSLKHLAAACGLFLLVLGLRYRRWHAHQSPGSRCRTTATGSRPG